MTTAAGSAGAVMLVDRLVVAETLVPEAADYPPRMSLTSRRMAKPTSGVPEKASLTREVSSVVITIRRSVLNY